MVGEREREGKKVRDRERGGKEERMRDREREVFSSTFTDKFGFREKKIAVINL